ncbi:hypothetical protein J8273_6506 [Carpediemonas membranifera]|uniref:Uncharacterized protein n=1 Tax=Carpediemonas membranifera TaxID=201153 RepID=A0A8J6AT54_9EUKA|nr:hypothetical protein J8273_6506 [Carpediemonas membranifera]|eukprot:KAG9391730.1 hypothetical protein J8273_6506 [Carpediemonas membranifera]
MAKSAPRSPGSAYSSKSGKSGLSKYSISSSRSSSHHKHRDPQVKLNDRVNKLLKAGYKKKDCCRILGINQEELEKVLNPKRACKTGALESPKLKKELGGGNKQVGRSKKDIVAQFEAFNRELDTLGIERLDTQMIDPSAVDAGPLTIAKSRGIDSPLRQAKLERLNMQMLQEEDSSRAPSTRRVRSSRSSERKSGEHKRTHSHSHSHGKGKRTHMPPDPRGVKGAVVKVMRGVARGMDAFVL